MKVKLEFLRISSIFFRSSHQRYSIQKAVLNVFVIFTRKQLWCSLFFNKVADLQACNFVKKMTSMQVFSCEIFKIFKNIYLKEYLWWLLLLPKKIKKPQKDRYSMKMFVIAINDTHCLNTMTQRNGINHKI